MLAIHIRKPITQPRIHGEVANVRWWAGGFLDEHNATLCQKDSLIVGTAAEQVGPLCPALHSRRFAGFAIRRVG